MRRIHLPVVALLGWCLAGTFAVVAGIQRVELQQGHLGVEWGNMAGWVASVGSIAAFGALLVAVMEWRRGQSERRDQEADQARLVFLVPLDAGPRPEDGVIWQSGAIRISNRSESPVFDVEAAWANTKGESSIRQQVLPPHEHTKAVAVGDPQQMAESLTFV